jgi:4-hydroxyphenylacetate 3-monooxygenase
VLLRVAQAAGIDTRADVMQMLGEAITNLEAIRNTTRSAELQATVDPDNGVLYPDLPALQCGRALGPTVYPRAVQMIRRVAGGGLVQLPNSMHEFDSPIGGDLEKALRGAGIGGRDKAQLLRLAWDICGSEFGARHELYEMNYAGDYGALLAGIQREYLRKPYYLAHLDRFLDSL